MMRDAKDQKMDLIICASISRFARNFSDCMTQIAALKTMHPAHPIGVYFETENIYTLNPSSQYNDVHSAFSARAFSGLVFQTLNWRRNCRYQCRGICQERENAKFLLFELDESRILIGKNHYEQTEGYSMNLKCRLYRRKWVQSITARDVMESGQVVENPMIGAIPSRNEVQRELDDLLMAM